MCVPFVLSKVITEGRKNRCRRVVLTMHFYETLGLSKFVRVCESYFHIHLIVFIFL